MHKFGPVLFLLALTLFMPSKSWADTSVQAQCVLKVGWEEWYPFIYKTAGKFAGSEYDLLQRLASKAGCQLVYIEASWDDSLKMLAEGKLDRERYKDVLMHRIDGENCYADEKLRRVQEWLSQQGINRKDANIRFY